MNRFFIKKHWHEKKINSNMNDACRSESLHNNVHLFTKKEMGKLQKTKVIIHNDKSFTNIFVIYLD